MAESKASHLRGLTSQWLNKIELAAKARNPWKTVADQCAKFFFAESGFMWKQEYISKYIGSGIEVPKFQLTPNEAFKLVSIMGPSLFWQYPNRRVQSHKRVEIGPEVFGDPNDPNVMALYESLSAHDAMERSRTDSRNSVMQAYLNYSQREQPGGLDGHVKSWIVEMMVRGRSLLIPQTYTPPGSDRVLTGLFHKSSLDFFVDPDAESADLSDAQWIALRWASPTWELEDRFGLERGSIKGSMESTESQSDPMERNEGRKDKSKDIVVWYEVFSKAGIGVRMDGMGPSTVDPALGKSLDKSVGNFAYLCICESCDYFLNAKDDDLRKADDDAVSALFAWPLESWRDNRWPVVVLDSHTLTHSPLGAWPMPPLGPTIGYLTAYNILMSAFIEQAYTQRKVLIGVLASEAKAVRAALKSSDNPALVEVSDVAAKQITDLVQYLTHPNNNFDILKAIEFTKEQIQEGTGLTPHTYAQSTTQSRSAEDVRVKEERAAIRQEQMAKDVARSLSDGSNLEMFLASLHVSGDDLLPLLGPLGVEAWKRLVTAPAIEDVNLMMREMKATIEASDIKRPSKARESANLQVLLDRFLPVLQGYAKDTGDSKPIVELIQRYGDSIEQDMGWFQMGEWRPQPDENAMAQMQADKEAEANRQQVEMMQSQVEMQAKQADAETKMQLGQAQIALRSQELQMKQAEHEMQLAFEAEKQSQQLELARATGEQNLLMSAASGVQKMDLASAAAQQKAAQKPTETSK